MYVYKHNLGNNTPTLMYSYWTSLFTRIDLVIENIISSSEIISTSTSYEFIHNTNKSQLTTIVPCEYFCKIINYKFFCKKFKLDVENTVVNSKKTKGFLHASVNNYTVTDAFKKIKHSLVFTAIRVRDIIIYFKSKYGLKLDDIDKTTIVIVDDNFEEHIFKSNEYIDY
jgi:hypothetical protein